MTLDALLGGCADAALFGLAPQPKGIGDSTAKYSSARLVMTFGLAPQPKGIGDCHASAAACHASAAFGLAPQPKGIGDGVPRLPPLRRGAVGLD